VRCGDSCALRGTHKARLGTVSQRHATRSTVIHSSSAYPGESASHIQKGLGRSVGHHSSANCTQLAAHPTPRTPYHAHKPGHPSQILNGSANKQHARKVGTVAP
jgi:hypothetical protein